MNDSDTSTKKYRKEKKHEKKGRKSRYGLAALLLAFVLALAGCGGKEQPAGTQPDARAEDGEGQESQAENGQGEDAESQVESGQEDGTEGLKEDGNLVYIFSAEELVAFRERVYELEQTESEEILDAVLTEDISLSSVCGEGIGNWEPIQGFRGTFDGDGHTISGLYIAGSQEDRVGLFSSLQGTVKNLGVTDVTIEGGASLGGIVGYSFGTLENCWCDGTVTAGPDTKRIGGVAGGADGPMKDCRNLATVDGGKASAIGGVVGELRKDAEGCCNQGAVTANGAFVGGIAGVLESGGGEIVTLTDCWNEGTVSTVTLCGGICGTAKNAVINRCRNLGAVETVYYAGGILGKTEGDTKSQVLIENCFNKGSVSGTWEEDVDLTLGGIVGIFTQGYMVNCYNTGAVTAKTSTAADTLGGLGGVDGDTVYSSSSFLDPGRYLNCYAHCPLEVERPVDGGGIRGISRTGMENIDNVFYLNGEMRDDGESRFPEAEFTDGTILAALQSWPEGANQELLSGLEELEAAYELSGWVSGADGLPCFDWEQQ